MKTKTVQYFSDEYLQSCKALTFEQILRFQENFRLMQSPAPSKVKSKLISIKIPQDLLDTFKEKAKLNQIPYQTQIKLLMKEWLS